VFYRELTALYNAFVAGRPSPLEPLPIQYADFAFWQRQWLQGEILETILAFWMRQLKGSTPLRFPTDYPRPDVPSYRGDEYAFLLPLDLFQSITLLNHQEGCTLFMLLLAAFQTLLYRYTDQTDIIVGTDIANRTRVETQFLIGFFVNLLVLRNDLSGAPTFRELLHRTKETVLDVYTYQDAPFEMLVEKLLPDHSLDRMPLVQVLFVLQNQPVSQVQQIPGIVTKPFINTGATTAKFDLAVFMQEGPDGLYGVVRYSSDLFKRSSIATLISRFEVLLRDVVTHPDASIDRVNFYTDAERIKQVQKEEASLRKLRSKRSEAIHLPEV
jgi:non-ribosomal peptide synthetase component F